jgi:hypothetical protein
MPASPFVMAGLVPAIHVFLVTTQHKDVDARIKSGHDGLVCVGVSTPDTPSPSRRIIRASFLKIPALANRGRRECRRVRRTRSLACKNRKHASKSPQVRRSRRHSLRNGFNGFFRDLLGEPGFLATVPSVMRSIVTRLISASGYRDHTTSPSAENPARLAGRRRPPHPAPNVRDDRETPLLRSTGC